MHEQKTTRTSLRLGLLFVLISQFCKVKFVRVDLRLCILMAYEYMKQICNWPPDDEAFQLLWFH
jgi:hypothetical protein